MVKILVPKPFPPPVFDRLQYGNMIYVRLYLHTANDILWHTASDQMLAVGMTWEQG